MKTAKVFVLAGPREKFNENEMNCLKKYIDGGGSLLVMLGDGGENQFQTNINFLLEEYGIMINNGKKIFVGGIYCSSICSLNLQILWFEHIILSTFIQKNATFPMQSQIKRSFMQRLITLLLKELRDTTSNTPEEIYQSLN